MYCPYCQQPVAEESVQCAACGLALARLDGVLGIPPVIPCGLTDAKGVLGRRGARQVKRAIAGFCDHFPQVQVAVVVEEAPASIPLRIWAWWLFNRGNFSAALDQGFMNRDLLLALDPVRGQLAVTVGYGLEPFVGSRDLADALAAAREELAAGAWAGASVSVLLALEQRFREIVGRMSQAYGVPLPLLGDVSPPQEAEVTW